MNFFLNKLELNEHFQKYTYNTLDLNELFFLNKLELNEHFQKYTYNTLEINGLFKNRPMIH